MAKVGVSVIRSHGSLTVVVLLAVFMMAIGFAPSAYSGEEYCDDSGSETGPADCGDRYELRIDPREVAGKTPEDIDTFARGKGLIPRGPDPVKGEGSYVDLVTGQQRVLIHPNALPPHAHVNNSSGERLDINGNVVEPESPEAHLPIAYP
jgi:hypothetical protein